MFFHLLLKHTPVYLRQSISSYNIVYVVDGILRKIYDDPGLFVNPFPLSVGGISDYDQLSVPCVGYNLQQKGDDLGFPLKVEFFFSR